MQHVFTLDLEYKHYTDLWPIPAARRSLTTCTDLQVHQSEGKPSLRWMVSVSHSANPELYVYVHLPYLPSLNSLRMQPFLAGISTAWLIERDCFKVTDDTCPGKCGQEELVEVTEQFEQNKALFSLYPWLSRCRRIVSSLSDETYICRSSRMPPNTKTVTSQHETIRYL